MKTPPQTQHQSLEQPLKRRSFIKQAALASSTVLTAAKAPYVFAKTKVKLRVMGTHVTLQEEIRQKAMSDLGIELQFEPKGRRSWCKKPPHSQNRLTCMNSGLTAFVSCGRPMPFNP